MSVTKAARPAKDLPPRPSAFRGPVVPLFSAPSGRIVCDSAARVQKAVVTFSMHKMADGSPRVSRVDA